MKMHLMTAAFLLTTACGGSDAPKAADAKPAAAKTEAPAPNAAPAPPPKAEPAPEVQIVVDDGTVATINLTANDAMQFNTAEIKVAAGRTIKLNLKHVGKMPAEMMGHNFVLLAQGTDISAFSAAGVTAKDTDYIAHPWPTRSSRRQSYSAVESPTRSSSRLPRRAPMTSSAPSRVTPAS